MNQNSLIYQTEPCKHLSGQIRVPGDKSISHRSIMLAAIAEGTTVISGFLASEDCLATLTAFENLGVKVHENQNGQLEVHGVGMYGLKTPNQVLDLGNSGTSIRLLAGLMAGQKFNSVLTGDVSLLKRPMARVVAPLRLMGAHITMQEEGTAPLSIYGNQSLHGIHYSLPVASAQVKSCLLLAGLYAKSETVLVEPAQTRDHTERMLEAFRYPVTTNGRTIKIKGGQSLHATEIHIPTDISSAAFFIVAASIVPNADIKLLDVGINQTRIGVINILRLMGANIEISNERYFGKEPVADIRVRSATLHGIEVPIDQVPLAIDEFPALFIAAACAKGLSILRGAKELRVKESDRISAMAQGLRNLGINAESLPDGMVIEGGTLQGGSVDSFGDHRIVMAFAIAGCVATGSITIKDCHNVATSFPNFIKIAQEVGCNITQFEQREAVSA